MTVHVHEWATRNGHKLCDPETLDLEKVAYDAKGARAWLVNNGYDLNSVPAINLIDLIKWAGPEPDDLPSSALTK